MINQTYFLNVLHTAEKLITRTEALNSREEPFQGGRLKIELF